KVGRMSPRSFLYNAPPTWSKCKWVRNTSVISSGSIEMAASDSVDDLPDEANMDRNFSSCFVPIPVSTRIFRFPFSMRMLRMAHWHRLRSSGGLSLLHRTLGTTPNIGPPSSLKYPESTVVIFIVSIYVPESDTFEWLETNLFFGLLFEFLFQRNHFQCSVCSFFTFVFPGTIRPCKGLCFIVDGKNAKNERLPISKV